jgi:HK97 family phage portal protein
MGFLFNRNGLSRQERMWGISSTSDLIPRRVVASGGGVPYVDSKTAMHNSAVWAAVRLRADLISTLPVDVYRYDFDGLQIDSTPSAFMAGPDFMEFVYSSQAELDKTGNAIGIIHSLDPQGRPAEIELAATSACDVTGKGAKILEWHINGINYKPEAVWHEKQYTVAGCAVGLSPIANSAFSLGTYQSIQEFAAHWFISGQGPRASLKNVEKKLNTKEATIVKEAWRASQSMGEPFVHGKDWEYNLIAAEKASSDWLDASRASNVDIARFMGVPADLLDAAIAGGPSVTYANITQKNLQFLIMHLGPAIIRRENAFTTRLLPRPRIVKLNSDALLRMDPMSRAQMIRTQIDSRVIAPSEARALDNRRPYTPDQIEEFELLGLNKTATGALTGAEGLPTPAGTQTEPAVPADPNAAPADNAPTPDQGNK